MQLARLEPREPAANRYSSAIGAAIFFSNKLARFNLFAKRSRRSSPFCRNLLFGRRRRRRCRACEINYHANFVPRISCDHQLMMMMTLMTTTMMALRLL